MKLYIANGTYVGTQADAKAIDKKFVEEEVPTDKAGLIAYLNRNFAHANVDFDQFETVVERNDPTIGEQATADYDLAMAFWAAPLPEQVELAEGLLRLLASKALEPTWIEKPDPRKDAEARKVFAAFAEDPLGADGPASDADPDVDPFA